MKWSHARISRYADVCKSQPLLDSSYKILPSKFWTLQNYLFNSISQLRIQNVFLTLQSLTYVFLHEIPQYEKIFVRCSTMHGGLQAGSTLPDPPSTLWSEFTIFVQKLWGTFSFQISRNINHKWTWLSSKCYFFLSFP